MTLRTPHDPPPTPTERFSSEQVAMAILKLVGERPGTIGRMRCARIIGGYAVPAASDEERDALAQHALLELAWPLRTLAALIDALADGGLLAQTSPPRPTLVLTRAGHRALDALERTPEGS